MPLLSPEEMAEWSKNVYSPLDEGSRVYTGAENDSFWENMGTAALQGGTDVLRSVAGVADYFTDGKASAYLNPTFDRWDEERSQELSPQLQEGLARYDQQSHSADGQGFGAEAMATFGALASNPEVAAYQAVRSSPSTGASLAFGGPGSKLAREGVYALNAAKTAAAKAGAEQAIKGMTKKAVSDEAVSRLANRAALKAAGTGAAIGEGVLSTGSTMNQMVEENLQEGRPLMYGKEAAIGVGLGTMAITKLAGKLLPGANKEAELAAVLGGARVASQVLKPKHAPQSLLGKAMHEAGDLTKAVIQEGLLEEAPQGALETALPNLAFGKPVTEGMGQNVVESGVAGGLMGGGMHMMSRPFRQGPRTIDQRDPLSEDKRVAVNQSASDITMGGQAIPTEQAQDPAAQARSQERVQLITRLKELQDAFSQASTNEERKAILAESDAISKRLEALRAEATAPSTPQTFEEREQARFKRLMELKAALENAKTREEKDQILGQIAALYKERQQDPDYATYMQTNNQGDYAYGDAPAETTTTTPQTFYSDTDMSPEAVRARDAQRQEAEKAEKAEAAQSKPKTRREIRAEEAEAREGVNKVFPRATSPDPYTGLDGRVPSKGAQDEFIKSKHPAKTMAAEAMDRANDYVAKKEKISPYVNASHLITSTAGVVAKAERDGTSVDKALEDAAKEGITSDDAATVRRARTQKRAAEYIRNPDASEDEITEIVDKWEKEQRGDMPPPSSGKPAPAPKGQTTAKGKPAAKATKNEDSAQAEAKALFPKASKKPEGGDPKKFRIGPDPAKRLKETEFEDKQAVTAPLDEAYVTFTTNAGNPRFDAPSDIIDIAIDVMTGSKTVEEAKAKLKAKAETYAKSPNPKLRKRAVAIKFAELRMEKPDEDAGKLKEEAEAWAKKAGVQQGASSTSHQPKVSGPRKDFMDEFGFTSVMSEALFTKWMGYADRLGANLAKTVIEAAQEARAAVKDDENAKKDSVGVLTLAIEIAKRYTRWLDAHPGKDGKPDKPSHYGLMTYLEKDKSADDRADIVEAGGMEDSPGTYKKLYETIGNGEPLTDADEADAQHSESDDAAELNKKDAQDALNKQAKQDEIDEAEENSDDESEEISAPMKDQLAAATGVAPSDVQALRILLPYENPDTIEVGPSWIDRLPESEKGENVKFTNKEKAALDYVASEQPHRMLGGVRTAVNDLLSPHAVTTWLKAKNKYSIVKGPATRERLASIGLGNFETWRDGLPEFTQRQVAELTVKLMKFLCIPDADALRQRIASSIPSDAGEAYEGVADADYEHATEEAVRKAQQQEVARLQGGAKRYGDDGDVRAQNTSEKTLNQRRQQFIQRLLYKYIAIALSDINMDSLYMVHRVPAIGIDGQTVQNNKGKPTEEDEYLLTNALTAELEAAGKTQAFQEAFERSYPRIMYDIATQVYRAALRNKQARSWKKNVMMLVTDILYTMSDTMTTMGITPSNTRFSLFFTKLFDKTFVMTHEAVKESEELVEEEGKSKLTGMIAGAEYRSFATAKAETLDFLRRFLPESKDPIEAREKGIQRCNNYLERKGRVVEGKAALKLKVSENQLARLFPLAERAFYIANRDGLDAKWVKAELGTSNEVFFSREQFEDNPMREAEIRQFKAFHKRYAQKEFTNSGKRMTRLGEFDRLSGEFKAGVFASSFFNSLVPYRVKIGWFKNIKFATGRTIIENSSDEIDHYEQVIPSPLDHISGMKEFFEKFATVSDLMNNSEYAKIAKDEASFTRLRERSQKIEALEKQKEKARSKAKKENLEVEIRNTKASMEDAERAAYFLANLVDVQGQVQSDMGNVFGADDGKPFLEAYRHGLRKILYTSTSFAGTREWMMKQFTRSIRKAVEAASFPNEGEKQALLKGMDTLYKYVEQRIQREEMNWLKAGQYIRHPMADERFRQLEEIAAPEDRPSNRKWTDTEERDKYPKRRGKIVESHNPDAVSFYEAWKAEFEPAQNALKKFFPNMNSQFGSFEDFIRSGVPSTAAIHQIGASKFRGKKALTAAFDEAYKELGASSLPSEIALRVKSFLSDIAHVISQSKNIEGAIAVLKNTLAEYVKDGSAHLTDRIWTMSYVIKRLENPKLSSKEVLELSKAQILKYNLTLAPMEQERAPAAPELDPYTEAMRPYERVNEATLDEMESSDADPAVINSAVLIPGANGGVAIPASVAMQVLRAHNFDPSCLEGVMSHSAAVAIAKMCEFAYKNGYSMPVGMYISDGSRATQDGDKSSRFNKRSTPIETIQVKKGTDGKRGKKTIVPEGGVITIRTRLPSEMSATQQAKLDRDSADFNREARGFQLEQEETKKETKQDHGKSSSQSRLEVKSVSIKLPDDQVNKYFPWLERGVANSPFEDDRAAWREYEATRAQALAEGKGKREAERIARARAVEFWFERHIRKGKGRPASLEVFMPPKEAEELIKASVVFVERGNSPSPEKQRSPTPKVKENVRYPQRDMRSEVEQFAATRGIHEFIHAKIHESKGALSSKLAEAFTDKVINEIKKLAKVAGPFRDKALHALKTYDKVYKGALKNGYSAEEAMRFARAKGAEEFLASMLPYYMQEGFPVVDSLKGSKKRSKEADAAVKAANEAWSKAYAEAEQNGNTPEEARIAATLAYMESMEESLPSTLGVIHGEPSTNPLSAFLTNNGYNEINNFLTGVTRDVLQPAFVRRGTVSGRSGTTETSEGGVGGSAGSAGNIGNGDGGMANSGVAENVRGSRAVRGDDRGSGKEAGEEASEDISSPAQQMGAGGWDASISGYGSGAVPDVHAIGEELRKSEPLGRKSSESSLRAQAGHEFVQRADRYEALSSGGDRETSGEREARRRLEVTAQDRILARVPDRCKPFARTVSALLKNGGLQLMFSRNFVEEFKHILPSIEKWWKAVERLMQKRQMWQQNAADIVERISKLSKDEQRRLNDLAIESTLNDFWAYRDERVFPTEEAWRDYVQRTMTRKGKEYTLFLKKYNALSKNARESLQELIGMGTREKQEIARLKLKEAHSTMVRLVRASPGRRDTLEHQYVLDENEIKADLAESLQHPYVPLSRHGDHVVTYRSAEYLKAEKALDGYRSKLMGLSRKPTKAEEKKLNELRDRLDDLSQQEEHYIVEFYESRLEANTRYEELLKKFPDAAPESIQSFDKAIFLGEEAPKWASSQKLLDQLAGLKEEYTGAGGIKESDLALMTEVMRDLYIRHLPDTSARKSQLKRRGIPGYSDNVIQNFVRHAQASSHLIAALDGSQDIHNALDAVSKEAKEQAKTGHRDEASIIANEVRRRQGQIFAPSTAGTSGKIMRVTSFWMLLTNPAFYLQNLLQPAMMSAPYINGALGINCLGELTRTMKSIADFVTKDKTLRNLKNTLSDNEYEAIMRARDHQLLTIGVTSELGEVGDDTAFGRATNWFTKKAQVVEIINRVSTHLVAYRNAVKKGMTHEEAMEFAEKTVAQTHGDYSKENAPSFFNKNAFTKVGTQFRKFQFIQTGLVFRMLRDSVDKELSPTERAIARRQLMWIIGTHFAMAGLKGTPLAAQVMALTGLVMGMGGSGDDEEDLIRKGVNDKAIADFLLIGIPSFVGLDLSKKVGAGDMHNPFPFFEYDATKGKRNVGDFALSALGPWTSILQKFTEAHKYLNQGDYFKALEQALPHGVLTNAMKAYRVGTEGYTSSGGDVLIKADGISAVDQIKMGMGLTPAVLGDRTRIQGSLLRHDSTFNNEWASIRRTYRDAKRDHDYDAMRQAWKDLAALNRHRQNAGYTPIDRKQLESAYKAQKKREANTIGGLVSTKQNRGFLEKNSKI